MGRARLVPCAKEKMDIVDQRQAIDIERLINLVHELQDKIDTFEGSLAQAEQRDRDRMVALRQTIRQTFTTAGGSQESVDVDGIIAELDLAHSSVDEGEKRWDSYRNSFTLLMSKGYLQTVDQLRDKLLATEWEFGVRPISLQLGVSRFEAYCAENDVVIGFDILTQLYEDPSNLDLIRDPHLRMRARAFIVEVETEHRMASFDACTKEAQKLAQQFSEGEFISKLLPDPIEHGMVDSLRKVIMPMSKLMTGGKA